MCGICGFYAEPNQELLKKMCNILRHRGPDDEGYYSDEQVSLGMRRLSIIDLVTGHQPISNEDKSKWVVFNGEIYNYPELRVLLGKKGHQFKTRSDTEVIVHLYEEFSLDFVKFLRGMFSIALWDKRDKKLILARDRVGKKPLYYLAKNGRFFFSSEMKSLFHCPDFSRDLDPMGIPLYLSYLYIPAPYSIFKDVRKLPPAHLLIFSKNRLQEKKYWELNTRTISNFDQCDLVQRVREKIEESVKIRLISDVPLGAFLSGGIDSSAIVGFMAKHTSKPVKTFTVNFNSQDHKYDETEFAQSVASYFGTEHHQTTIEYKVIDLLPKVLWHFDEPFGNSTSILAYLLSEFTKKHVTVALSGTGGDEAFLGYPRYWGIDLSEYYHKIPPFIRTGLIQKLANLLPESTEGNRYQDRFFKRIKRFVKGAELEPNQRYLSWLTYFDSDFQRNLLAPKMKANLKYADLYLDLMKELDALSDNPLDKAFLLDIKTFLPFNQLEYMDKMSMAKSLEARCPFCDHELLELSAGLPSQLKLRRT
ncbi:MAG: asparagine synthase (glutamine-hydrolyzing), partial [Candidatus Zixiibacteriota bacterium]